MLVNKLQEYSILIMPFYSIKYKIQLQSTTMDPWYHYPPQQQIIADPAFSPQGSQLHSGFGQQHMGHQGSNVQMSNGGAILPQNGFYGGYMQQPAMSGQSPAPSDPQIYPQYQQQSLYAASLQPILAQYGPQALPSLNNLYKTQLCKHYQQTKHCHVGSKCHFAHGENELRKKEDPLPVDVQMKMLNIPYNNFKTQKCKYYYESDTPGQCKFGKNCSYAHGEEDMRNPYINVDLSDLVREHYGIEGYDPNAPMPSTPNPKLPIFRENIANKPPTPIISTLGNAAFPIGPPSLIKAQSLPQQAPQIINGQYVPKYPPPNHGQPIQNGYPPYPPGKCPQYIKKTNSAGNPPNLSMHQQSNYAQMPSPQQQIFQGISPGPMSGSMSVGLNGSQASYTNQIPLYQEMTQSMIPQAQQSKLSPLPQQSAFLAQQAQDSSSLFSQPIPFMQQQNGQQSSLWSSSSNFPAGSNGFNYMLINPDQYHIDEHSQEGPLTQ